MCNIPGLGLQKERKNMCEMHSCIENPGIFSRFQIKLSTETEVSLELMELK
jgi:hypothetical protein